MNNDEKLKIIDMLENGYENDFLDFKLELYDFSSKDKKQDFLIDMMSLANSYHMGDRYLIIGARDMPERIIKGINKNEIKDSSTYYQFINENIEPSITFEVSSFNYKEKDFLIYKIPYSSIDRPYLIKKDFNSILKGTCRIRKGSQNSFITRYDLDKIYKNKLPNKKSELVVKSLNNGEMEEKLIIKNFDYSLEHKEDSQNIIENIDKINKMKIDDLDKLSVAYKVSLGKRLYIDDNDKKVIEEFVNNNNLEIGKDFFDVGDVECFSMGFAGNYTGSNKSIEKYKLLIKTIDKIKIVMQEIKLKRELNNLYFTELVVSNIGGSHDELVDIIIKIPKDKILMPNEFPVPEYELLEKYEGMLINNFFKIKETYNTSNYNSRVVEYTYPHVSTSLLPTGIIGNYRRSYEDLKEDYIKEIEHFFDYETIRKDDYLYMKHTQKIIKPDENILFPCRIFLKGKIEKIEYSINSKLMEKSKDDIIVI